MEHPLPSAEHISQEEAKPRPLPVEPWVLAYLSRVWQDQKKHLRDTIASGSFTPGQANSSGTPSSAGKLVPPRSDQ